jgi:hypothetical protein
MSKRDLSIRDPSWFTVWLIAIGMVASSIVIDARKLMWADEIYTVLTSRQPNISTIVEHIKAGCEGIPPLYLSLVHVLMPVLHNDALAARLPSTLGFGAMILGVFAFCRVRMSAVYSLLAALLCSQVALHYASEGRPYGAALGCAAWALVFWQRSESRPMRDQIGLAICLGLMAAFHYYAICFVGPLLLAELITGIWEKKWNYGVIAAMAVPFLVLAIHYPLIHAQAEFRPNFWEKASLRMIAPFYEAFLGPMLLLCGSALAAFTLCGIRAKERGPQLPMREAAMLIALCATPALTVVVSMFTTEVFVDRYALWATTGFAITTAVVLERWLAGNEWIPKIIAVFVLVVLCAQQATGIRKRIELIDGAAALNALNAMGHIQGPIVIPESHTFIELAYYAPDSIRNQIVYPASRALDIRYLGSDSSVLQYVALGKYGEIAVQKLNDLLSRYSAFTMVAYPGEYLPEHLRRNGWRVKSMQRDTDRPIIWSVSRPRDGSGRI